MIQLSRSAASEVLRLRVKRGNPNLFFRLSVQPYGCLGSLYSMQFDEAVKEGDRVTLCEGTQGEGIQVVVDAHSWPDIADLSVDYSEDLMGGGFRFHNPTVSQTCGCGNSFKRDRA